jgi:hypothetical protein
MKTYGFKKIEKFFAAVVLLGFAAVAMMGAVEMYKMYNQYGTGALIDFRAEKYQQEQSRGMQLVPLPGQNESFNKPILWNKSLFVKV